MDKNLALRICEEGVVQYDTESAHQHYEEHVGKQFYDELEKYITSGKAYGIVVKGVDAIKKIRTLVQKNKESLQKGDIRFDIPKMLGIEPDKTKNVIHASDSQKSAEKEIKIFESLRAKEKQRELNDRTH